ncbi:MAG: peptide ABC transporter permease, partial [Pollutimonas bauzanensis]
MFFKEILHHRAAFVGSCILVIVVLAISLGRWLIPYSSIDMDFANIMAAPSLLHPFGTDSMGRDVLAR